MTVGQVSLYLPEAEESKKRLCVTSEGEMRAVPEWLLETEGSNLLRVLSDPEVDTRKTSTNHIVEIFSVSRTSAMDVVTCFSCRFFSLFFLAVFVHNCLFKKYIQLFNSHLEYRYGWVGWDGWDGGSGGGGEKQMQMKCLYAWWYCLRKKKVCI